MLAAGFNLFAPPLESDRSFASTGTFGSALATALNGDDASIGDGLGDEVYLLNADGSWQSLYLDSSGHWRRSTGELATNSLAPGQGVMLLRNGSAAVQVAFSGAVGNTGTATNQIFAGWNLLGLSLGRSMPIATAFADTVEGVPTGDYDEQQADLLVFRIPSSGQWKRLQRLPDGSWLDLQSFQTSTFRITPGVGGYYFRQPGSGQLSVRF